MNSTRVLREDADPVADADAEPDQAEGEVARPAPTARRTSARPTRRRAGSAPPRRRRSARRPPASARPSSACWSRRHASLMRPTVPAVTDVRAAGTSVGLAGRRTRPAADRGYLDRTGQVRCPRPPTPSPTPTGPAPPGRRSSYRDFRLIWLGLFASNIGTWMQNFTLPAYVEHRTGVGGARRAARVHAARPAAAAVDPRRRARRPLPAPPVPRRDAGDAARLQRRARGPRRRATRRCGRCSPARSSIGIGNALNAPAFQASVPAARAAGRPRRRRQPQLGDDQRQPGARPGARRGPRPRRRLDVRSCSSSTPSRTCS